MPTHFSDYYRTPEYWTKNSTELNPPETPEHLPRFLDIDPTPRIKKTQAAIHRTLLPGPVPHFQRHWLRIKPNTENFFHSLTGPSSTIVIPPSTHQIFVPPGPGPWNNQYKFCKTSVPYKYFINSSDYSGTKYNPDGTKQEKEHIWE